MRNRDRRTYWSMGDLPPERAGRRILDPGVEAVTDWVNRNSMSLFPFTTGAAAQEILPANALRTYVAVQNKSGGIIYVNFGQRATAYASFMIAPGQLLDFGGGATGGGFSPSDSVWILGSAAGLNGCASEGLWTPYSEGT